MKCPFCGSEMQKGWLRSTHPFFWSPEQTAGLFIRPGKKKGAFYVSEGFWEGASAPASWCAACGKLILSAAAGQSPKETV